MLKKHKFYARLSNDDFYEDGIHYLGHIILDRGISIELEKIEAMRSWPAPRMLTYVRYFVGLAAYCRRFTKGYSVGKVESMHRLSKPAFEHVVP